MDVRGVLPSLVLVDAVRFANLDLCISQGAIGVCIRRIAKTFLNYVIMIIAAKSFKFCLNFNSESEAIGVRTAHLSWALCQIACASGGKY